MGVFGTANFTLIKKDPFTEKEIKEITEYIESRSYDGVELEYEEEYELKYTCYGKGPYSWNNEMKYLSKKYELTIYYQYNIDINDGGGYKDFYFENGKCIEEEKEKGNKRL